MVNELHYNNTLMLLWQLHNGNVIWNAVTLQ